MRNAPRSRALTVTSPADAYPVITELGGRRTCSSVSFYTGRGNLPADLRGEVAHRWRWRSALRSPAGAPCTPAADAESRARVWTPASLKIATPRHAGYRRGCDRDERCGFMAPWKARRSFANLCTATRARVAGTIHARPRAARAPRSDRCPAEYDARGPRTWDRSTFSCPIR